ncbi:MAG: hypothetical protein K0S33_2548 [Bacteroidetes bacterium]|nr:hypothetical protein [Bacteroidota bacterium]
MIPLKGNPIAAPRGVIVWRSSTYQRLTDMESNIPPTKSATVIKHTSAGPSYEEVETSVNHMHRK